MKHLNLRGFCFNKGMIYSDFQAFFGVGFEAFGPEEELLQQICKNVEAIFFILRLLQKLAKYGWGVGLVRGGML